MSDLMVLNMGELALPFDDEQAKELTQGMTAGFATQFKRAPRLFMGNSGDWELVDENGESYDLGREVNLVIVDQRQFVSRVHFSKSFDEMKAAGEFEAPDCQSYDGITPDKDVETPYSDKCKTCTQMCAYYRRIVGVLAYEDGTFSDPFVFEPKAKSLFDKTVVKERYGSYGWYMNVLANQKRNGVTTPVPTQAVVTYCTSMPKMEVATIKFGVASTPAGGYWTLNKAQFDEIIRLKNSDEVKEMLEPFNAATNNPTRVGQIPVLNISAPAEQGDGVEAEAPKPASKPAPKPASKPAPKPASKPAPKPASKPAPKPEAKKVVILGLDHPDVKNSEDFDYEEIVAWAKDADEADVNEWLEENFPQALKPVETTADVDDSTPVPTKKAPVKRKAKVVEPVAEPKEESTSAETTDKQMEAVGALTDGLSDFDD